MNKAVIDNHTLFLLINDAPRACNEFKSYRAHTDTRRENGLRPGGAVTIGSAVRVPEQSKDMSKGWVS